MWLWRHLGLTVRDLQLQLCGIQDVRLVPQNNICAQNIPIESQQFRVIPFPPCVVGLQRQSSVIWNLCQPVCGAVYHRKISAETLQIRPKGIEPVALLDRRPFLWDTSGTHS